MSCSHKNITVIDNLFAKSPEQASWHRRQICNGASPCGIWCERLIKGIGKLAYCHNVDTKENVLLNEKLKEKAWHCPLGLF